MTFVFSNLATSLDGKIATTSRVHFPLGTKADRELMLQLRGNCDALLMGATTLRAYKKPCPARGKVITNVIISRSLEGIDPQWDFFSSDKIKRILMHTHDLKPAQQTEFSRSSRLIRIDTETDGTASAPSIIEALRKEGLEHLLVEGGGGLMWNFVRHDLIDEYYVTLTPRILGGKDAPSLVEGSGLEPPQVVNLKLKSCRQEGDELFLVYSKTGRRGSL